MSQSRRPLFSPKLLCVMAIFAALTAICSWISFPVFSIPITLQLLAVMLCASLLEPVQAFTAVLVYILLGLIGLPVFSGFTGGVGRLFGITGGYIIGFLPAAWLTSFLIGKWGRSIWKQIIAMILGVLVCYLFGTLWFMMINQQNVSAANAALAGKTAEEIAAAGGLKTPYSFIKVLSICVIPYIPFDLVKVIIASVLGERLYQPFTRILKY